jgi:uncharacterized membrane protein YphA (DoxX/SURF4 family)
MTKETLMSPELDKRIPAALLILRFFLAIFLLQWSIEKLILPNATAGIARNFYGVTLPAEGSYALGIAELIVSLALLLGLYRTISYGLSLLIHTVTVVVSWRAVIRPMGTGQGRQPPLDIDVANLGRFCRPVPDAGMGHLDCRWLASVAKRTGAQTGNERLVMEDAVAICQSPIRRSTQQEERLWLL